MGIRGRFGRVEQRAGLEKAVQAIEAIRLCAIEPFGDVAGFDLPGIVEPHRDHHLAE